MPEETEKRSKRSKCRHPNYPADHPVNQLINGEPFLEKTGKLVKSILRKTSLNKQTQEDLGQEILLALLQQIDRKQGSGEEINNPLAYTARITKCEIAKVLKSSLWKNKLLSLDSDGPNGKSIDPPTNGVKQSAQQAAEDFIWVEAVMAYIDVLPKNERTTMIKHSIEGLDNNEIAALLNVSAGCVGVWLHRGRERLKKKMGGEDD